MNLGFVGLGAMGAAIAPRLLNGGHALKAFNRTASKSAPLVKLGATAARSLRELNDCEVIISMLSDDDAVAAIVEGQEGLAASAPPGTIHVCMATISPEMAKRAALLHEAAGQYLISAPVLGRPAAAEAGQLAIMPAGNMSAVERCMPLFELMGQTIIQMGEEPHMANVAKIGVNFLVAAAIESMAESFALVRKAGINPEAFLRIVTGTVFNAPVYNVYAPYIAREVHRPPLFKLPLGLKDVRLALAASMELNAPLPIGSVLQSQMTTALARGFEDSDWSVLGVVAAQDAGLPPLADRD